ncbi:hypothetical protein MRX96_056139 [Rhipicephalus microplus]
MEIRRKPRGTKWVQLLLLPGQEGVRLEKTKEVLDSSSAAPSSFPNTTAPSPYCFFPHSHPPSLYREASAFPNPPTPAETKFVQRSLRSRLLNLNPKTGAARFVLADRLVKGTPAIRHGRKQREWTDKKKNKTEQTAGP